MGYPDYEGQVQRAKTPLEERERIDRVIATGRVLQEVWAERDAQDEKWGQQNWEIGSLPSENRILAESMAKASCDAKLADGSATWVDILNEEFTEFAAAPDLVSARNELVQVAAVAVAAVERLDRLDHIRTNEQARTDKSIRYHQLLRKHAPVPHEGHDMTRDTVGACSPTRPCPACVARLKAAGKAAE